MNTETAMQPRTLTWLVCPSSGASLEIDGAGWYRERGLESIQTTEVRQWGFGVVGTKPPASTP